MTIIERDIAFYRGEVDRLKFELRRALPDDEAIWQERLVCAAFIVAALEGYERLLAARSVAEARQAAS